MRGGDEEVIRAVRERRWRTLPKLTSRERALLALAEKLSATPTRMVEEDWAELRGLGFDDRACLEVGHIVAFMNYATRLADGFGLAVEAAVAAHGEG